MKSVAIIPARGGSTRIPRKNIKKFLGRPMISYPIESLKKSGLVDRIIVSTDDDEIAEVAIAEGAEVPFLRPAELSCEFTGTMPVIKHAIEWLVRNQQRPDYVCCVYATTPLLDIRYLKEGFDRLVNSDRHYAFSMASYGFPVQRALKMSNSGGVEPMYPDLIGKRSQDLEASYHDAGQFYWGTSDAFLQREPVFSDNSIGVVMPRHLVQDIDDEEDWQRAEYLYRIITEHKNSENSEGE